MNSLQLLNPADESRATLIKLNAFKNGVNEQLKSVIFAARPATLSEAISLAFEVDLPTTSGNVFKFDSNKNKKTTF